MTTPAYTDAELERERRRVVRHFQRYTPQERADRAASRRLGHRQRVAVGETYFTHPYVPNRAFSTRTAAAKAAIGRRPSQPNNHEQKGTPDR